MATPDRSQKEGHSKNLWARGGGHLQLGLAGTGGATSGQWRRAGGRQSSGRAVSQAWRRKALRRLLL